MNENMLTLKGRHFQNFEEAADSILHMLSENVGLDTLFIAKNDRNMN